MITRELIEKQKETILKKKPELERVRILPYREWDPSLDYKAMEQFMEDSWADTYGNEPRFFYSEDYLRWDFTKEDLASDFSLVAIQDDKILGQVLFTGRRVLYREQEMNTGIMTALSINQSGKGMGIPKMFFIELAPRVMGNLPGLYMWFDSTSKSPGSSYNIYKRFEGDSWDDWGTYPINFRAINTERCFDNLPVSKLERIAIKFVGGMPKMPRINVQEINQSNIEEVGEFFRLQTYIRGEGRLFSPEQLEHYALAPRISKNQRPFGLTLKHQGDIKGVMIGYPIEVRAKNQDKGMIIDHIYIDDSINPKQRRQFRHAFELMAYERHSPYAFFTIGNRFGISQGYLPIGSNLSLYGSAFEDKFIMIDNKKRTIPPMDHK